MLQKLNDRHRDIIRRLIVGQQQIEIAMDLGMSQSQISALLKDPLFRAKLEVERERTMEKFHETRSDAMAILQEAAPEAAQLVVEAFKRGTVKGREISVGKQLESAFDVLDRTGNKAIEKSLVGKIDLGQLIVEAYREKRGDKSEEGRTDLDERTDDSFDLIMTDEGEEGHSSLLPMVV